MKHFNTARTLTAASLLALAAFGAQAAVPSPEENGPVRQVCPQIDSKMQQALDRSVQKLNSGTLARVEFTVKGDKISQLRQQNVPTEMRRQVQQAMRELKCQSNGEQALAFNLNLLPN